MENIHPILAMPIDQLATSEEFLKMTQENGFNNLGEIVKVPVYDLVKLPLSGFRILNELITILSYYKLESCLIED